MRNRYDKEIEDFIKKYSYLKKEQVRLKVENKFNLKISRENFEKYLYRHNIKCSDYHKNKARDMQKVPIGSEYVKSDGIILVKTEQPSKYEYKQRVLYKKYHNCELTSDDYIIFLNQDRTDFSKENLVKISRRESAILSNQKMFSSNKDLTQLGILTAKLMIKAKEKEIC